VRIAWPGLQNLSNPNCFGTCWTPLRAAFLYAADERCRGHARKLALAEAQRLAGCELAAPNIDVESRARGSELHLCLDVEAQRRHS